MSKALPLVVAYDYNLTAIIPLGKGKGTIVQAAGFDWICGEPTLSNWVHPDDWGALQDCNEGIQDFSRKHWHSGSRQDIHCQSEVSGSDPFPGMMVLFFVVIEYSHLISSAAKSCHRGTQKSGYPKLDISAFRSPAWFADSSSDQKGSIFCR